jgi:anaerobic selenocysteine-containing dehydrogenase
LAFTEKVVNTFCGICDHGCGMKVYVKNGEISRIDGMPEHVYSKGTLCVKGRAAKEIVYAPDRIKYPLKREDDEWKRISWNEALEIIAKKLTYIKENYGPNSLVIYEGQALSKCRFTRYTIKKFCSLYGTSNHSSSGSECFVVHMLSNLLTYGALALAHIESSNCILIWGSNPYVSGTPRLTNNVLTIETIRDLKRKGVKLIVIDPRKTETASDADIFVQIKPGTDLAFALGMISQIISENLYDEKFVEQYTEGFEQLKQHVTTYTPENVEKITGVPSDILKEVSRIYAVTKPACIHYGSGLEHGFNALQSLRALDILIAITGNIDVEGGNILLPVPLRIAPTESEAIGVKEHPLFVYTVEQAQAMLLPEAIINERPYPIKGMIVAGGTPLLTWPNSNKVREALNKLEFLVVMDLFMSETAKLADIVLPAASFLERDEISISPIILQNKAVQVGECWPDWKFWLELSKKMGYEKDLKVTEFEKAVDFLLLPMGLTYKQVKQKPGGIVRPQVFGKHREKGFGTPSGKVEIYSKTLETYGYDPLPKFSEPTDSLKINSNTATKYPLILITGGRLPMYVHTTLRNIPTLRRMYPEPTVELNPQLAHELGIKDDQYITVESVNGELKIKGRLFEGIAPGVIHISHGWREADCNILTSDIARDPVSGFPSLKYTLCRIVKQK